METYEAIKNRIESYVETVAESIQCPTQFQLVFEKEDGSNKKHVDCAGGLQLFAQDWPELFISKRVFEMIEENTIESMFEAEKVILHELVHLLMFQSLEIMHSVTDNRALHISIERDTDTLAMRYVNLLRQCNVKL